MNHFKIFILTKLLFLITVFGYTQNIERLPEILKKDAYQISGNVNLRSVAYKAFAIDNRRAPLTLFATGKLNFKIHEWNVPVTFSFAKQKTDYKLPSTQPFNYYGIQPYYKWIKLYLGRNVMSFSKFTFSRMFYGIGMELTPKDKLTISSMWGRIQDPISYNSKNPVPRYSNKAYGMRINYGDKKDYINFIWFGAKDDIYSINIPPDSLSSTPSENIVMSLQAGKYITNNLMIKAEYANSIFTNNINDPASEILSNSQRQYNKLISWRNSTSQDNAFKTQVSYKFSSLVVGAGYERIDPGYTTKGIRYLVNDRENFTMNASSTLLHGLLVFSGSFGKERDNLDGKSESTNKNFVSAINFSIVPSARININGSYSNFTYFANVRSSFEEINTLDPYIAIDTLNYSQISSNSSINIMYLPGNLGNKETQQSIMLNASCQIVTDSYEADSTYQGINNDALNWNGILAYSLNSKQRDLNISIALNSNYFYSEAENFTIGPTVSASKYYLDKKIRTSLSSSFNKSFSDGKNSNWINTNRLNGIYKINKKHNLNANVGVLIRKSKSSNNNTFSEFTFTAGYFLKFE